MCIHEYFWLVLCWEVCPLSEYPLLEVIFTDNVLSFIFKMIFAVHKLHVPGPLGSVLVSIRT